MSGSGQDGGGARPPVVLAVACLGAFLTFVDVTVANVAFPDIQRTFPEASLGLLSWVFNAYNVVFAGLLIVAGRAVDLVGRRRGFEFGIAVFTVASVLVALAPTPGTLIAARALQGLGAAVLVPASLALVLDAYPGEGRTGAIGVWAATGAVAAGVGPIIGGVLVEVAGWRSAFLVNLPVGVLTVIVTRRLLFRDRGADTALPDVLGATIFTAGTALGAIALVQGTAWGWSSPATVTCLGLAGVLVVAAGRRTRQHPVPFVDPGLLRLSTFRRANTLSATASGGSYALLLTDVLFLHDVWGFSALHTGASLVPAALATAAAAKPAGWLADRLGHRAVAGLGATAWAIAAACLFLLMPDEPSFLVHFLPPQIAVGVGIAMVLPTLGSASAIGVPVTQYGVAAATNAAARQLGSVIGIAAVITVVGTPGGGEAAAVVRNGWAVCVLCLLVTALGCLRLPGRPTRRRDDTGGVPDEAVIERVQPAEG